VQLSDFNYKNLVTPIIHLVQLKTAWNVLLLADKNTQVFFLKAAEMPGVSKKQLFNIIRNLMGF